MPPFQNSTRLVESFLAEALSDTSITKADGTVAQVTHVALCHMSSGPEKEIAAFKLLGKSLDARGIADIAQTIVGRADSDAAGLQGRQKYVAYAFFEGNSEPLRRRIFSTNGHILNESGDTSTEPATNEGRLAQRMRHDEAYSQMLTIGLANLVNQQNNFIERVSQRAHQAEQENMQMFSAFKELAMREATEQHERRMKEENAARMTKLVEGAIRLAPLAINTITGREVIPQSAADTELLKAVAENVDIEESLPHLMGLLAKTPDAVKGLLLSRLTELVKEAREGKERVQKALDMGIGANGAIGELEH